MGPPQVPQERASAPGLAGATGRGGRVGAPQVSPRSRLLLQAWQEPQGGLSLSRPCACCLLITHPSTSLAGGQTSHFLHPQQAGARASPSSQGTWGPWNQPATLLPCPVPAAPAPPLTPGPALSCPRLPPSGRTHGPPCRAWGLPPLRHADAALAVGAEGLSVPRPAHSTPSPL